MHHVPHEVVMRIFGFSSLHDLGRTSSVCLEWERLASDRSLWNVLDLKKQFPSLTVIDEAVWENHADLIDLELHANDAPPLEKCDI